MHNAWNRITLYTTIRVQLTYNHKFFVMECHMFHTMTQRQFLFISCNKKISIWPKLQGSAFEVVSMLQMIFAPVNRIKGVAS